MLLRLARPLTRSVVLRARIANTAGAVSTLSTIARKRLHATPTLDLLRTSKRRVSGLARQATGTVGTKDWRLFFFGPKDASNRRSPWHDLPLFPTSDSRRSRIISYVNEIPKGTRPKMEIQTKEKFNPIGQDIKKDKLRLFTYGDIPFNYGAAPQTWEDPNKPHPDTGLGGDNDPLDIVEVSQEAIAMGETVSVKVLGVLALLDEGETDWKLLAISTRNPLCDKVNDCKDLEVLFPGIIDKIRHWFRYYKTTDGKPENKFAFEGQVKDAEYAMRIVDENHRSWQDLVKGAAAPGKLAIPAAPPS